MSFVKAARIRAIQRQVNCLLTAELQIKASAVTDIPKSLRPNCYMDVWMDLPGYKKWWMYWKLLLFDNSQKREVQDIHLDIYIFEIIASPEDDTQSTIWRSQKSDI